jgi:hypothetical protein
VSQALERLERELAFARNQKSLFVKFIHGYGSTGAGGEIRIAVQKRLVELVQSGGIRACIFGENWSKSDGETWKLLESHRELRHDEHLGRRNRGITIVAL